MVGQASAQMPFSVIPNESDAATPAPSEPSDGESSIEDMGTLTIGAGPATEGAPT